MSCIITLKNPALMRFPPHLLFSNHTHTKLIKKSKQKNVNSEQKVLSNDSYLTVSDHGHS